MGFCKIYIHLNRLTGYKETDIRKIYRMERLLGPDARKIYGMERTMERVPPTVEKQIEK